MERFLRVDFVDFISSNYITTAIYSKNQVITFRDALETSDVRMLFWLRLE